TDVAEPYGDIVYLGDSPAAFIKACERALHAGEAESAERVTKMREVLARTSWDETVKFMGMRIDEAIRRRTRRNREGTRTARNDEQTGDPASLPYDAATPPVVVVGAGPTGLSAAYHLGRDALLLERNG